MPLLSIVNSSLMSYTAYFEGGMSINNLDNSSSTIAMTFPQLQTINNIKFSGAIETYKTKFSFRALYVNK